jgi:hypothetical protein
MYKLIKNRDGIIDSVIRPSDGACIPFDTQNVDYQQYLKFLENGGIPLPAENT